MFITKGATTPTEEEIKKFIFHKSISPTKLKKIDKGFLEYDKYLRDRTSIFLNPGAMIGSYVDDKLTGTYKEENYVFLNSELNFDSKTGIYRITEKVTDFISKDNKSMNKTNTYNVFDTLKYSYGSEFVNGLYLKYAKELNLYQKMGAEKQLNRFSENLFDVMMHSIKGKKVLTPSMLERADRSKSNLLNNKILTDLIRNRDVEYQKILIDNVDGVGLKAMLDIYVKQNFDNFPIAIELKYIHTLEQEKKVYYDLRYYIQMAMYRKLLSKNRYSYTQYLIIFYNEYGVTIFNESEDRATKGIKALEAAISKYLYYKSHDFNYKTALGSQIQTFR